MTGPTILLRSVPLRKLNEILAVPLRGFTGSSVQDLHSCTIQWQFFVQHIILSRWWKPLGHWLYQDRKFHCRLLQLITIKETTYYVNLHCVQGGDRSETERNIHTPVKCNSERHSKKKMPDTRHSFWRIRTVFPSGQIVIFTFGKSTEFSQRITHAIVEVSGN